MLTTSLLPDVGIELREGYAEVGDVSLHVLVDFFVPAG
jgi:hypothetical protein